MYQSWGRQYSFNDYDNNNHFNSSPFNVSSMRDSIFSLTTDDSALSDVSMEDDIDPPYQHSQYEDPQLHHKQYDYPHLSSDDIDMDVVMDMGIDESPPLVDMDGLSHDNSQTNLADNHHSIFDNILADLDLNNEVSLDQNISRLSLPPIQSHQPSSWSTKDLLFNPTKLGAKLALSNEDFNNEAPPIDLHTVVDEAEVPPLIDLYALVGEDEAPKKANQTQTQTQPLIQNQNQKQQQSKQSGSEKLGNNMVDNFTQMNDNELPGTDFYSHTSPDSSDSPSKEVPDATTRSLNLPINQALALPYPTLEWFHSNHDVNLPYILSSYLQVLYHLFLIGLLIFIIVVFIRTLSFDINTNMERFRSDQLNLISQCSRNYVLNKCMPGLRAPILEKECNKWESCMSQDPDGISRLGVAAHTITGTLNSFFDPMSSKTILALLIVGGFVAVVGFNFGFGYLRAKAFLYGNNHGNQQRLINSVPKEGEIS